MRAPSPAAPRADAVGTDTATPGAASPEPGRPDAPRTLSSPVAADLLFALPPRPDWAAALRRVNRTRAPGQAEFARGTAATLPQPEAPLVWTNGALRVALAVTGRALPDTRFAGALTASLTRIKAHDYAGDVARHAGAVTISVSAGAAAGDTDAGGATLADRIIATQRVALALAAQTPPLLVYWAQSDMLFSGDELAATAPMDFPVTLVTRPGLYDAPRDPLGRARVGLFCHQSQLFCGKPLIFAPSVRPVDEILATADLVLLRFIAGTLPLGQGDVYHLSETDELRVSHTGPRPDAPGGAIQLTFARRAGLRRIAAAAAESRPTGRQDGRPDGRPDGRAGARARGPARGARP